MSRGLNKGIREIRLFAPFAIGPRMNPRPGTHDMLAHVIKAHNMIHHVSRSFTHRLGCGTIVPESSSLEREAIVKWGER